MIIYLIYIYISELTLKYSEFLNNSYLIDILEEYETFSAKEVPPSIDTSDKY